jgi:hypothetical protein
MISDYILIFKTNLDTEFNASHILKQILANNNVLNCNFDLNDCDKILRIVLHNSASENMNKTIIDILKTQNFNCVELVD